ncbi:hypothetical protein F7725_010027 [Dissostichus mawsoni]|uniref:Ig-like domain-containing protein n=1 Tax=Dissostichus mawsoni TaxID=36200 RepID=A0A7J5XNY9_DISMA|nr:hypothetical protein F7725_010027 [Dissostichus mawsoni]
MKSHQSVFPSAPVSSVWLASECLSQGEKRVSCSSGGGDSPQYSWTLGGRSLTDTELLSVNTETNSITLRQHVSGAVACSVRNNITPCSYVLWAAVVVFALIGIAVYFAWKNKNYKKAEGSAYRPEREHQDESVVMVEM